MKEKISVIIPVYKCEKYIAKCIESVLEQTYKNFELILVDDGSPDNSGVICDEYAQKDLRVRVIHKENGGVSSARNIGMDNAQGKYIMFVDSDDYIDKDMLECLYCDTDNKSIDLVVSGLRYIFDEKNCINEYKLPNITLTNANFNEYYQSIDLKCGFDAVYAKLFKKSLITDYDIRFEEGISRLEDGGFVLEYLKYSSATMLSEKIFYNYRQTSEPSLMKRFNANALEGLKYYYHTSNWLITVLNRENRDFYYQKLYNLCLSFLSQIVTRSNLHKKEQRKLIRQYLKDVDVQEIIHEVRSRGFSFKKRVLHLLMKFGCFRFIHAYLYKKRKL